MKKKIAIISLLTGALCVFSVVMILNQGTEESRAPSSIPNNYEAMKACEKQDVLWSNALSSVHKELPEYQKMGAVQLLKMSRQEIEIKGTRYSDFAPKGWIKYLHRRGALAKVKIIPKEHPYTGIFQGADCGLLRLSLTYKVAGDKPVAPGLALKILRDGAPSANVSALYSLDGQDLDYNFFKNAMSNIVPIGHSLGQKLVHKLFRTVSGWPEELGVTDMATINAAGEREAKVVSPRQLFFVPAGGLSFASNEHDVRTDFLSIPEGTVIYQIHAVDDKYLNHDYYNYTEDSRNALLKQSVHIADIVTTSEFVASEFGDDGIFFRHEIRK